jgi:hypothetical protein
MGSGKLPSSYQYFWQYVFLTKTSLVSSINTRKLYNLTLSFGHDIPISMYDLLFLTPKPIIVIGY